MSLRAKCGICEYPKDISATASHRGFQPRAIGESASLPGRWCIILGKANREMGNTTSMLAASAWADGSAGPLEAVGRAVAGLDGDAPSLVLLFPDSGVPAAEALRLARSAAPGLRLAGMTSDGVISSAGAHSTGCVATAFGSELSVGVGLARNASLDARVAGRDAAERALAGLDPRPGHTVLLLFVDPLSADEALAIDGAYSIAGGRIPLAGGGANGPAPALFADDVACTDSVVAVAMVSPAPIAVSVADGCRPRADPAIATRTEGRALRELNGLPAEEVYLEGLGWSGVPLDDEDFEALAILHPLGQSELRGEVRLRHVTGRAEGGGLACATPIPPNAAVWFTEQTPETIIDSATDAVDDMLELLPGPPRAGLVFDCAARKRALGPSLSEEAAALSVALGDVPLTGLYTRGEVGRTRGAKGDRNHAVVVVGFG